jgi:DNA-binding GntR family transcriptional regulator
MCSSPACSATGSNRATGRRSANPDRRRSGAGLQRGGLEIVGVHQTLTLGSADPVIAELLQTPLNAPIAYVDREAVDQDGCVVFVGKGIYRGDVIRLDIKLK